MAIFLKKNANLLGVFLKQYKNGHFFKSNFWYVLIFQKVPETSGALGCARLKTMQEKKEKIVHRFVKKSIQHKKFNTARNPNPNKKGQKWVQASSEQNSCVCKVNNTNTNKASQQL